MIEYIQRGFTHMMLSLNFYTFFKVVIVSIICFLTPILGLLSLVIAATFLDTAMGLFTSRKLGIPFESDKFFNLSVKLFFYLSTIILAYVIDLFILEGEVLVLGVKLLVAKLMSIFWVYNEMKSIDESNIRLGNKSFSLRLKSMLSSLKNIKKDLKDIIDK